MNTDSIADLLTRIRNACRAGHKYVEVPSSKLKQALVQVLQEEGFIKHFELKAVTAEQKFPVLRIALKYDTEGYPVIHAIQRVSRPGLRRYRKSNTIERVLSGAGVYILSTNKGLMTDRKARREKVGGEVLCMVQ